MDKAKPTKGREAQAAGGKENTGGSSGTFADNSYKAGASSCMPWKNPSGLTFHSFQTGIEDKHFQMSSRMKTAEELVLGALEGLGVDKVNSLYFSSWQNDIKY